MWCTNMPYSHAENICTHEDAMSDLVCGGKKYQISDRFIHFISDFSLFGFPSHKDSLSLFCLVCRSLCTSTFYPPHFLCCRHLFSFHLAFLHIVPLFVINLPRDLPALHTFQLLLQQCEKRIHILTFILLLPDWPDKGSSWENGELFSHFWVEIKPRSQNGSPCLTHMKKVLGNFRWRQIKK